MGKVIVATSFAALLCAQSQVTAASPPRPAVVTLAPPASFGRCASCHSVARGGSNGIGPNLWGVADREPASKAGYEYSPALKKLAPAWTPGRLAAFVQAPATVAPGTKMFAPGVSPGEAAAIARYLANLRCVAC
jgi:cytochrome c